jgi:5-methylcytosine-specific restriction endonuclease McrA
VTLRYCLVCRAHHPSGSTCPKRERRRYAASRQRRTRSTARRQQARAAARRRDGNRCRRCGSTDKLEVHHIVGLQDGGSEYDLNNLITLCSSCHHAEEGHGSTTGVGAFTPAHSPSRNKRSAVGPVPRFSRSELKNVPDDDAPPIG